MNNPQSRPDLMPLRARRREIRKDYPTSDQIVTKSFPIDFEKMELFMLKHSMRFASFRDVVSIYRSWIEEGKGLTSYAIVMTGKLFGGTFQACNARLRLLASKGFISVIGYRDKYAVYAPTDKAIKELSELCEGV